MLKNARNTAINADNIETKSKEPYHFAGGLKYKPQTIKASSREEAQEKWESTREKI